MLTLTEGRAFKKLKQLLLKAKEDEVKQLAKELFNQWKSEEERRDNAEFLRRIEEESERKAMKNLRN